MKQISTQPEQEPVAWMLNGNIITHEPTDAWTTPNKWIPLYTTPPQRKPLTDEDIAEFAERMEASDPTDSFWREFARAIEVAHGIKE